MNIHEYQAKELLKRHGVAVPDGSVAWTRMKRSRPRATSPVRSMW